MKAAKREGSAIAEEFYTVRSRTNEIVKPLEIEDYVVQTAPFMSPPRWHVGHTSWFFEMVLKDYLPGYRVYSDSFLYYFNSYYERYGSRIAKDRRGTRSRPTVKDTMLYRTHVDTAVEQLLRRIGDLSTGAEVLRLIGLGLEHEMQHQELLVYDIKHLLCEEYDAPLSPLPAAEEQVSGSAQIDGGLFELGWNSEGFAYDNEKPAHLVYLNDFSIDKAPVTNGQYLEFIRDGGYTDYKWWYSDGWATAQREEWEAPLYWVRQGGEWLIRDFAGLHKVEDVADAPVSHVSFYEASAFASWAGKRLPSESEWEKAASFDGASKEKLAFPWGNSPPGPDTANLSENRAWRTSPAGTFKAGRSPYGCYQMIGNVWEWTTSDYAPYPGFKSEFDEYNDKWFIGQKVLRGGSFATPRSHIRTTYRNFFYPYERWMICGFRCAQSR